MYLTDTDNLYINLFMKSESKIDFGERSITLKQETEYPWDGQVKFKLDIDKPSMFSIKIRVPDWAREEAIPLGLYKYTNKVKKRISIKINGKEQKVILDKGYAVIQRNWQTNDEILLVLPMEIRRVVSDEKVKDDLGRVAIERGPIVYCAEWVDNNGKTSNIILPDESKLSSKYVRDLIGGITIIEGKAKIVDNTGAVKSADFKAIPYFAWLNRGKGEMDIWLPRNNAIPN